MGISDRQKRNATRKLNVLPVQIKGRGTPPGGGHVSKSEILARMLENNGLRIINGELIDPSNNVVAGVASYTKAEATAGGFDTTARHFLMSDVAVDSYGGDALYFYDPLRTTQPRVQPKPWVYQSTFANLLTNFPAATWPGQIAQCGDVPGLLISNGARYVPLLGEQVLNQVVYAGTVASPTKTVASGTSGYFSIGTVSYPANLFAAGDTLEFKALMRINKGSGGGTTFSPAMRLGTLGDNSDSLIYSAPTSSADNLDIEASSIVHINTSTSFISALSNGIRIAGGTTDILRDRSTQFNVASALYFQIGVGSMTSGNIADLYAWSVKWRAAV